jgi:hypothetical protein
LRYFAGLCVENACATQALAATSKVTLYGSQPSSRNRSAMIAGCSVEGARKLTRIRLPSTSSSTGKSVERICIPTRHRWNRPLRRAVPAAGRRPDRSSVGLAVSEVLIAVRRRAMGALTSACNVSQYLGSRLSIASGQIDRKIRHSRHCGTRSGRVAAERAKTMSSPGWSVCRSGYRQYCVASGASLARRGRARYCLGYPARA